MTDATAIAQEEPVELVPPIPPPEPPALDAAAERALPSGIDNLGVLRRSVLDHLLDTEGPQSVAQILAAMPAGTTRGNIESALKRNFDAGLIERVGAGLYVLAKARPVEQTKPASPEPIRGDGHTDDEWLDALERWAVDRSWDTEKLGPPLDQADTRVPPSIKLKFSDRLRKRHERRREAEAARARQSEADRELRGKLIEACHGGCTAGPALNDVRMIRAAMELVPLNLILRAIRYQTDPKCFPQNEPARSWGEERLLKAVAELYCRCDLIPRLVSAWGAAGKAPGKPADAPDTSPAVSAPPEQESSGGSADG